MSDQMQLPEIVPGALVIQLFEITRSTLSRWVHAGLIEPMDKPNKYKRRNRPYRFTRAEVQRVVALAEAGELFLAETA